jgi:hypothetical protein
MATPAKVLGDYSACNGYPILDQWGGACLSTLLTWHRVTALVADHATALGAFEEAENADPASSSRFGRKPPANLKGN